MHANKVHFIDFNMSGDAEQKLIKQYIDEYNLDPNSLDVYNQLEKVLSEEDFEELKAEAQKYMEMSQTNNIVGVTTLKIVIQCICI